jgi:uncharacterized protein
VALTLTGLNRYPVKSCRGETLTSATVEPWGLRGDRRWMIVDEAGETVTAREHPRMLLIHPELVDGGLQVSGPDAEPLLVPVPDGRTSPAGDAGNGAGTPIDVTVFKRLAFAATLADDSAHAWFSKVVGESVRLVYGDDPTRRPTNRAFSRDGDCVSFADGYPLLLTAEESLDRLNEWIADGPLAEQGPLPMRRFRPNVVVAGAPAFDEDSWRRIRIGEATFRTPKGCDRCVITTTNPDTAARGKEPLTTLARHRKWDGATWFAMNLIPDNPGAVINVGDEVEIIESVDSDGPPR